MEEPLTKIIPKKGLVCFAKYKLINRSWMETEKLYNLPVFDETDENLKECEKITWLALCRGNVDAAKSYKFYRARFERIVDRNELKELKYPAKGRAHAKKYFLFKIEPVEVENPEFFLNNDLAGIPRLYYLRDFFDKAKCRKIAEEIKSGDNKAVETLRKAIPYTRFDVPAMFVGEAIQTYFWGALTSSEDETKSAIPFPPPENPKFKFIDLFAGIGGFRIALQNLGGECVFSSEWDKAAQETYLYNFGERPFGDITKKETKDKIPDSFDILCGGFPCQAFSIAGYQRGFEDTRGTLFFDVAEIVKKKRPAVVFLENVKNLQNHDSGKTFQVIKRTLEDLDYIVFYKVMNAMEYANIPQNRERIFIVCFDPKQVKNCKDFVFPQKQELTESIYSCIDEKTADKTLFYTEKMGHFNELKADITDKNTIYQWRRQYVRQNKSSVCPTLTANMGTGGHNVPLILTDSGIRKLSPKECLNFQGYPRGYSFPRAMANSSKYKQAGNSVVVPLIQKICQNIIDLL